LPLKTVEAVFCHFPSLVGREAGEEDHLGCTIAGVLEVRFTWAWRLAAAIAKLKASAVLPIATGNWLIRDYRFRAKT